MPGYLDSYSAAETNDYAEAIDWAGVQPWSNGKVGLIRVSYFTTKLLPVAVLQPKQLAAMIPWDLFATLWLLGPNGEEVVYVGAHEPTLVTRGWLQASHRKLNPERI